MMPHRALAVAAHKHPFAFSLVILLAIVIPGFLRTQQAINRAEHAIAEAHRNAVVACQNDNERAEAGGLLWKFILGTPPQMPPRSEAERHFRADLQRWINQLYESHDCNNLDKKYKLPAPPTLDELRRLRHNNSQPRR